MSIMLRVALIIGSTCTTCYFLRRIRQSKVQIEDTVFWILACLALIGVSVFPQIADIFTHVLGIISTVNFVFLFMIFILLLKIFSMTIKLSVLDNKLKQLTQKFALEDYEKRNEGL
ncbi:hypothetical protein EDD70_2889 [Hydrogenoanaerobacterium saccharovorans]|uniref:DUF2304 domain-containing protein n=1 Tax=Hydrogenoanaerobacterium saccharovorans TaxID=474960 RepID=A0A1H8EEN1_9FIRM|nr:DUF2304 domain-containing protein [Hydrogenoanaerobacterium saccharovorans]RPF42146.1 hypothetical protein EDD70_2889 [Hydrogenoanaerobacterium saccharovorans]SEN17989.1 hypothetical protein SAMN05216180_2993 [Hydrogenoanaerobacterium saccharovorans]